MLDCRITPALKAIRTATDEEELSRLRRYLAINIGDRESLRILLGLDPEEFARFYPDMSRPELSTEDTIDSFLDKFSSQTPQEPESEAIPAAPPADYASEMLSSLPEMEADSDSAPIPDFPPEPAEYMTQEEKAAALVREGKYAEALNIITFLRTQYPAKAYYMDDQIRFLNKLIENSRH